jgi:hypothetical protein
MRKPDETQRYKTVGLLFAMSIMFAFDVWAEWDLVAAHKGQLFGFAVMAGTIGGLLALALRGE